MVKSPVPGTPLGSLLASLSDWTPISEFEGLMNCYFTGQRTHADIADFRTKRGAQKTLRDEIAPVLHHVKFVKAKGEIKFSLSNDVPDCWLREKPTAEPQGLEVTVALSREQYYLGEELNEKGISPGIIGLQDNAPSKVFKDKLARGRVMFSPAARLKDVATAIRRCLEKKAHPKYRGFDLLVEAPLHSLSNERWSQIEGELRLAANKLPFREIHVIGDQDTEPFGFRIK